MARLAELGVSVVNGAMSGKALPSRRTVWGAWVAFVATFPAGILVGCLLGRGQDAAGSGVGLGLGMLGVGLLGGIATATLASYFTARAMPRGAGKLLAFLPWVMLVSFWWMALFTATGDRLAEWLESL